MAYTKLFSSIITSTIWMENDQVRLVWITMLAVADKNGEVQGSIPGLARIAGVPVESARDAILRFLAPDPDSRTKDDEGRRIEVIDGGWRLLNHRKYRDMCSRDEAREAEAKRKAAYRDKVARNGKKSGTVPDKSRTVPVSLHIADADTKAEAEGVPLSPPLQGEIAGVGGSGPAPRARNLLLDALATVGGGKPTEVPSGRWPAVQKCLREIKGVCPEVSVEEIARRCENYHAHFRDANLTPEAITKHWATCDSGPRGQVGSFAVDDRILAARRAF